MSRNNEVGFASGRETPLLASMDSTDQSLNWALASLERIERALDGGEPRNDCEPAHKPSLAELGRTLANKSSDVAQRLETVLGMLTGDVNKVVGNTSS